MQLNVPIDVADTLQQALNAAGIEACARPVPRDLAHRVPLSCVEAVGGDRSDVVLDRHAVRIYTWDVTAADATVEACRAVAAIEALAGQVVGGTQVYRTVVTSLPYHAHDEEHQDLARVAFTAQVWARATTIEQ